MACLPGKVTHDTKRRVITQWRVEGYRRACARVEDHMRTVGRLWFALAAAQVPLAVMAAPIHVVAQEVPSIPTPPSASRPSAPEVPPVVVDGVRYEQDLYDDRAGDQHGGYLAAVDAATGQRLWRVKVYTLATQPSGAPALAFYFRSMRPSPDDKALVIENEAGGVDRVDLATHASVQIGGPPETAPAATPGKPKPPPGG